MNQAACAHCGLPTPGPASQSPAFCCTGCERVYGLLHAEGLEAYYQVRALSGEAQAAAVGAEEVGAGTYAYLDEHELQARIGPQPGQARLQLTGMHCPACVWLIERLPDHRAGFESARVDLGRGHVDLRFDPAEFRLSQIAQLLGQLGYTAHVEEADAQRQRERDQRRELIRLAVAGACAGNVMLLSFGLHAGRVQGISTGYANFLEWAAMLIALPAVTYGAWPFFKGVVAALKLGRLHLDLPISLGIVASYTASVLTTFGRGHAAVGSYYDSVTALVFLLLVGRWIQSTSQRRAMSRWSLLQRLLPQQARMREPDGGFVSVPISRVRAGDVLEVRSGEAIPTDARVIDGQGMLDAAALTGESRRQIVVAGDTVLAGCRLVGGRVELQALRVGEATRIGKLADAISVARTGRLPLQRAVDRLSGAFALVVVLVAIGAGVAWWSHDPTRTLDVVVAVLVVSCPCALGIATPMALTVARARAADRGFSITGDTTIERLAGVEEVVFDKTGTLTHGQSFVEHADAQLADYAAQVASLEAEIQHPLAGALRKWAEQEPATSRRRPAADALHHSGRVEHPGQGVEGRIADQRVRIGRPQWLGVAQHPELLARVSELVAKGLSPVALEVDNTLVGLWGIGDRLRADAGAAVQALQGMGLRVSIASGDHPQIAEAMGQSLGIFAKGGLSPQEKIDFVRARTPVAMVGDGINDAAAMQAAQVGIAVNNAVDVASSVADVRHLRAQGVQGLVELFACSRATMRLIRRNLGISLAYNIGFGAAAVAGWIDPLVAAIGMPLSSLSVIGLSAVGGGFRGQRDIAPAQSLPPKEAAFAGESRRVSAKSA